MMLYLKLLSLEILVICVIISNNIIGIGKSCVLKRLVENDFKDSHDVTVGVEFGSFMIRIEDKILKL